MKTIEVVAAVIEKDGRIFATQRGYGAYKDKWEFPGGKIQEGETPQEALKREIKEELDTEIEVLDYIDTVEYDYPEFHLSMRCYWCSVVSGELSLLEHEAARWLSYGEIHDVDWLPADEIIFPRIRADHLKKEYNLEQHPEGGWFSEVYTAPFEHEGRSMAGSIYFLLDKGEISHFHRIDCDEVWYMHEGCGLKVIVIEDGSVVREELLGHDVDNGQKAMVVIPKGAIFAAENLTEDGFSFVSCMTAPQFSYDGFELLGAKDLGHLGEEYSKYFAPQEN